MKDVEWIPYQDYTEYPTDEMLTKSNDFYQMVKRRRSVREFSDKPVTAEIIKTCIMAAGTAPSGANLQPWHFAVVQSQDIKEKIRQAAEKEEREFYETRAPEEWLEALRPLGTDANKEFLTIAPYLIGVFAQSYNQLPSGKKVKNYYVQESVGLAAGILITALHNAGLVTLTHTPSPMNFLNEIMGRPKNERALLLIVTGYPAQDVKVPQHATVKKGINEIASFL